VSTADAGEDGLNQVVARDLEGGKPALGVHRFRVKRRATSSALHVQFNGGVCLRNLQFL